MHTVVDSMVDKARNKMKTLEPEPDFRVLRGTSVMAVMKRDASAFHMLNAAQNFMSHGETSGDVQEQEEASRSLNYQLLIIMHADVEMRPCRPILRIVSLPTPPNTVLSRIDSIPDGRDIVVTCQLGDCNMITDTCLALTNKKILCVYALSLTDAEANSTINNISQLNTLFTQNSTVLSERSNLALLPVFLHKTIQIGARCISDMKNYSTATDCQIAIIAIMESIDKSRSLSVRVGRLHPYLSTPENLHEAISMFMRSLDVSAFKNECFKFKET